MHVPARKQHDDGPHVPTRSPCIVGMSDGEMDFEMAAHGLDFDEPSLHLPKATADGEAVSP